MTYSLRLLQNNTDEQLWNKSYEDYQKYHPIEQGGPLMLILLMKRITNTTESAITQLREQMAKLSISAIPGEDVDQAVRLIMSTFSLLVAASTDARNYVPDDFPETVLKILQTTSVDQFNLQFAEIARKARVKADSEGLLVPEFPSVESITQLATNSYNRLKEASEWTNTKKTGAAFVAAGANPAGSQSAQRGGGSNTTLVCWNCSGPHLLRDCPEPKDQAKIDAARSKFRSSRRPKHKTSKEGKPLILNKRGLYVLDTKKWRAKQTSRTDQLAAMIAKHSVPAAESSAPAPAAPPTSSPETEAPPAASSYLTIDPNALATALSTMKFN